MQHIPRVAKYPYQQKLKKLISTSVLPSVLAVFTLLSACSTPSKGPSPQQVRALAMWQDRCQKSGVFIHKTVENVEGVYLINVRTKYNRNQGEQPEDQFKLTDPYGSDSTEEYYFKSFLQGFYHQEPTKNPPPSWWPPREGYGYVEAVDYKDGKLKRYTGRIDQPWLRDKRYAEWAREFVIDRTPISKRTARYGVKFEDISTREEREHWIAGSSLKVIDLDTQEVLGERIGYLVDLGQGSRGGGAQPWTLARRNACPNFIFREGDEKGKDASLPTGQTLIFVEKILKPIRREK
jgi:hypothetical protein